MIFMAFSKIRFVNVRYVLLVKHKIKSAKGVLFDEWGISPRDG